MSATGHLGIKSGAYDKTIATLIPHYGELIDAAAQAVDVIARNAPAIVDLGTGSGALLQRIAKVRPQARLIGIDADAEMLGAATTRLGKRLQTIHQDFEDVRIPRCDVVSASFALRCHRFPPRRAPLCGSCRGPGRRPTDRDRE
jgi:tRNA G46 methylase TrmB